MLLKILFVSPNIVSCALVEFTKELADLEVPELFSGELECAVSNEDAEGKWYKGDVEIQPSSKYYISSRRGRHTLTVKDVIKEDQGRYSFVVEGKKTSCNLKMKPIDIVIPLKDVTVIEGTKAVLECKVSVAHITSVKWYFNDQPIQLGDRIQAIAKGAKQRLVISKSFASDEGCYKLVIGKTETSCNLSIERGAISKPLKDQTVPESQPTVFECMVANADSEGIWSKDGKPITFGNIIRSEVDGVTRRLIIDITKSEDAAEYSYQVANSKTSAKLKVE
eukprot:g40042.t1